MKTIKLFTFALILSVISACGSTDTTIEKNAVTEFHKRFNAEQYEIIYSNSDEAFKSADSLNNVLKYFKGVKKKLGNHLSSQEAGWRVNVGTNGKTTSLQFSSKFAKGEATESFVFITKAGVPKLQAYNIQSNAFIYESDI